MEKEKRENDEPCLLMWNITILRVWGWIHIGLHSSLICIVFWLYDRFTLVNCSEPYF